MQNRKRRLASIALALAALAVGLWLPGHLEIAATDSVGYHLFWRTDKVPGLAVKGDYVSFVHTTPWYGAKRLTKQVACATGEILRSTDDGRFYCGEQYLGQALKADSAGASLPVFRFDGPVPEGKIFVRGRHDRSFDSRYFGWIERTDVQAILYPLF